MNVASLQLWMTLSETGVVSVYIEAPVSCLLSSVIIWRPVIGLQKGQRSNNTVGFGRLGGGCKGQCGATHFWAGSLTQTLLLAGSRARHSVCSGLDGRAGIPEDSGISSPPNFIFYWMHYYNFSGHFIALKTLSKKKKKQLCETQVSHNANVTDRAKHFLCISVVWSRWSFASSLIAHANILEIFYSINTSDNCPQLSR